MTWAVITFVVAALFFTYGAASNGIERSWKTAWEIVQAAAIVVFIVGLATNWRGCSMSTPIEDVRVSPSPTAGAA